MITSKEDEKGAEKEKEEIEGEVEHMEEDEEEAEGQSVDEGTDEKEPKEKNDGRTGDATAEDNQFYSKEFIEKTFDPTEITGDIKVPADDNCFYHCLNRAIDEEAENHSEEEAKKAASLLKDRIVKSLHNSGNKREATRLMGPGAAGYPDADNFEAIAKELQLPFAVRDFHYGETYYGDVYGPSKKMIIRHHHVKDGQGHKSPHYDIISYGKPTARNVTKVVSKESTHAGTNTLDDTTVNLIIVGPGKEKQRCAYEKTPTSRR
jgi:hypothetical protein